MVHAPCWTSEGKRATIQRSVFVAVTRSYSRRSKRKLHQPSLNPARPAQGPGDTPPKAKASRDTSLVVTGGRPRTRRNTPAQSPAGRGDELAVVGSIGWSFMPLSERRSQRRNAATVLPRRRVAHRRPGDPRPCSSATCAPTPARSLTDGATRPLQRTAGPPVRPSGPDPRGTARARAHHTRHAAATLGIPEHELADALAAAKASRDKSAPRRPAATA